MPYFWPQPIYEGLVQLASIRKEFNLNEMVVNILKEELRRHKLLKPVGECIHGNIYSGTKFLMCRECGFKFQSENMLKVIQSQARERIRKDCKHPEWELVNEKPIRCKVCGIDYATVQVGEGFRISEG